MINRRSFILKIGFVLGFGNVLFCSKKWSKETKPNILWIVAEDMSPNWSCYGEKTIETPHIDQLAKEGIRFTQAFAASSVSSPSRSALISGMYQTKIGSLHHRSQRKSEEPDQLLYQASYQKPVKLIPELFQEVDYFTVLGGSQEKSLVGRQLSKSDYNFIWDENIYDAADWSMRKSGQSFFAQIQLPGGKARKSEVPHPVDPNNVHLPPYYPDHPVMREDWAGYLNSIVQFDREVGEIIKRLDDEDLIEDTIVFIFSDHGINHLRGKQFLYDEGIRVPLIIWGPGYLKRGKVRDDLVGLIDVAATSLDMADIAIPDEMDGQPLFGKRYKSREFIASARDRCDETVDCIRSIRIENVKYIRNYFSDRPYMQPNQMKDNLQITQAMRKLLHENVLLPAQSQILSETRASEELYIYYEDLHELNNLASSRRYGGLLNKMRRLHLEWMRESKDMGLIPEPILEEMGKEYGNKYRILQHEENQYLIDQIREVIELGENGKSSTVQLIDKLSHSSPSVRFRAAYELGNLRSDAAQASEKLLSLLDDHSPSVRIVAARSLCLIGFPKEAIPVLLNALKKNTNHVVRHYAALFFDDIGELAKPYLMDFKSSTKDLYEPVRLVAQRLRVKFENV